MYCTTLSYLDSTMNPALIRSPVTPQHTLTLHTHEHTHTHALGNRAMIYCSTLVSQLCLFLICCNTTEVSSYSRAASVFLRTCRLHRLLHKLIKIPLGALTVSQPNYLLFHRNWYHPLLSISAACVSPREMRPLLRKFMCILSNSCVTQSNYLHHGWLT